MNKKHWSKPELIILLMNHPEETLQGNGCKHPGILGPQGRPDIPCCAEHGTACHSSSGVGPS